jgi:simple sugar transport system permease protein
MSDSGPRQASVNPPRTLRPIGIGRRLANRPEFASIVGLVAVWVFFAISAGRSGFLTVDATINYFEVAAQVGIVATAVTLLMIAGDFDLSVGSQVGFTAVIAALCIGNLSLPIPVAVLVTLSVGAMIGLVNGLLVVKTGLPSFLVTLGTMFLLRGSAIGVTLTVAGSPILGGFMSKIDASSVSAIFAGTLPGGIQVSVVWWLGIALVGAFLLSKTTFGNWIYGTGGSAKYARALGVPTDRVRVLLFVAVGVSSALLTVTQVLSFGSAEAGRGAQKEFEAIITAVVGGSLLTGGYGSPLGTVFGALTIAIVRQGLFFVGVPSDWYQAALGLFLLVNVLLNQVARRRASETHR